MTRVLNGRAAMDAEVYSGFARFLHWTVAACVLIMIPVGITMNHVPAGMVQNVFYTVHRSLGVLVLALMLVRLAYRLIHGAPAPEPSLAPLQRIASELVHLALYALLIAQSLIGWLATSAYGAAISFFGIFTVPALVAKDEGLSKMLFPVHGLIGFLIAGLLCMHIGAALYHHFIRHDGVLRRMLP